MTVDTVSTSNPCDPSLPDEAVELGALARSLQLAEGFSLLFVRCNRHDLRQRLVATLRELLPQLNIEEVHFREPIRHLLDELRWHFEKPPLGAVFVSGLEYSLPTAADAYATPLVANLNAARNSFSAHVPCPLVLWVPEYVLTGILRGAPDFFSVRSGIYYFAATSGGTAAAVEYLTAGEAWQADNLPLAEKLERIASIESLLADYRALPSEQRDLRAEARLLHRLGDLFLSLGRWGEAEEAYQQSLTICREFGDRIGEGKALMGIGTVYHREVRWQEAEEAYQQSLTICREFGDRIGEGKALTGIGNVYHRQGRWQEAEEAYQRSLTIRRESAGSQGIQGDRVGEGATLNNLGIVYQAQGRWAEAEEAYQRSLTIRRHFAGSQEVRGDRVGEGHTLNNLAIIYQAQGRWLEAEAAYQQDLAICREVGDLVGEGTTLENLSLLREAQGDVAGALEMGLQALRVLETTEDEAGKAEVRRLIEKWEEQATSAVGT